MNSQWITYSDNDERLQPAYPYLVPDKGLGSGIR